MSWGRAFLTMLLHSLWIGPLLGMATILLIQLLTAAMSGAPGASLFLTWALPFSALLGLVIASPACVLFGTIMLRLSISNRRIAGRWIWALVGAVAGCAIGALFGLAMDSYDLSPMFVFGGLGAVLGALGAFLARRVVSRKIAEAHEVDADVFA